MSINPFQGIYYDNKLVNVGSVTGYFDVTDEKNINTRDPHHYLQFFKRNSGNTYNAFLRSGILLKEVEKKFYLLKQEYTFKNETFLRQGFIGEAYIPASNILLHESIYPSRVSEQIELIKNSGINPNPIEVFYESAEDIFQSIPQDDLDIINGFVDEQGTRNEIYRIDIKWNEKISQFLSSQKLFLADGHHRYAAALQLSRVTEQPFPLIGFFFNATDYSPLILPFHRVITGIKNFTQEKFLRVLSAFFDILKTTDFINGEKYIYRLVFPESEVLIKLKPNLSPIPWKFPEPVLKLDLTVLHYYLFSKVLGFSGKIQKETLEQIKYTDSEETTYKTVRNGMAQFGVIVKAPTLGEVKEIAESGSTFPQKSTLFYPKITGGLIINEIQ